MTILRCGVLVLLCSAALPWTAHADDIILDGEAACLSIGGAWSSGTCTVDTLVVPAGTRLRTYLVGLSVGEVIIDGALEVLGGSFRVSRSLLNRGGLSTESFGTVISGPMVNRGTWANRSPFFAENTVVNEWNFVNLGHFSAATFINRGGVRNGTGGWFSGGSIVNEGLIVNNGYFNILAGAVVDNLGGIENYDGTTFNYGTARSRCGSAWFFWSLLPGYPPGRPEGNPIEFDPCQATDALAAMGQSVLAFGERGMYSKDNTIVFLSLLLKADKRLEAGLEAEAVALLHTFNAEVYARIGYYPIGGSLILRANRAVELITNP